MIDDPLGLVGTSIADKYDVKRVVGEGGFAVVYRAEHRLWKRPVAIKVFKALADLPEHARDELTANFIREGALLAELSEKSASICQARDVGVLVTAGGTSVPYMVLEWLEGESLEDALRREQREFLPPRSLDEVVRLIEPVADALALAHARGIAHRDVKPANIFLLGGARDARCPVKLLDFGIAKVVQDMQKTGGAFTKTSGALTSFTPAYAAPEQFSRAKGSTGPWTDVFSLALVAVELLTGKAPLEGDSFLQLGFAAGDTVVRPTPRTRGAVTSDAVEAVFERALAVECQDRYPSAEAFWRDLREATGRTSSSSVDLGAASTVGPRSIPVSVSRGVVDVTGRTATVGITTTSAPVAADDVAADDKSPGRNVSRGVAAGVPLAVLGALIGVFLGYHFLAGGKGATSARAVARAPATAPTQGIQAAASAQLPAASPTASACPEGMAYVPGGSFFMGADDGLAPERPAHKIMLPPYCMDVFEVTTAKYVACSENGNCKRAAVTNAGQGFRSADQGAYDALCNARDVKGRAQHPINCVTWEMADAYCRTAKLRLPTEAEWEFAARGSDGRLYPWGDAPPSAAHLNACGTECAAWGARAKVEPLRPMYAADDGYANTAPVGSFPQGMSKFGIMDLAGNVWEWVGDWYGPYAAGDPVTPVFAPHGPAMGKERVIRGGAWNGSEASWERPSFRYSKEPADRNHGVGFRCAAEPR